MDEFKREAINIENSVNCLTQDLKKDIGAKMLSLITEAFNRGYKLGFNEGRNKQKQINSVEKAWCENRM